VPVGAAHLISTTAWAPLLISGDENGTERLVGTRGASAALTLIGFHFEPGTSEMSGCGGRDDHASVMSSSADAETGWDITIARAFNPHASSKDLVARSPGAATTSSVPPPELATRSRSSAIIDSPTPLRRNPDST
jgi:hypothetical protein